MGTVSKLIDHSYGHTDSKEFQNLQAFTGNGAIKGFYYVTAAVTWDSTTGTTGTPAVDLQSITSPGVALGDIVLGVSVDEDIVDATITGYVSAADTIILVANNNGGTTFNPGLTNVRVLIADCT